jgi:hypothetical protein
MSAPAPQEKIIFLNKNEEPSLAGDEDNVNLIEEQITHSSYAQPSHEVENTQQESFQPDKENQNTTQAQQTIQENKHEKLNIHNIENGESDRSSVISDDDNKSEVGENESEAGYQSDGGGSDDESNYTDKIISMLPEYNVLARFLHPTNTDDSEETKNITDVLEGIEKEMAALNATLKELIKSITTISKQRL